MDRPKRAWYYLNIFVQPTNIETGVYHFMKVLAKFLTTVTALVLLACGYVLWASELKVTPGGGIVESAADRASAFESIRESSEIGSPDLVMFAESIDYGPEQYVFVTYTLRMRNMNIIPAEWLQIDIQPQAGDVLMVKAVVEDVPAFNEQLISVVLLTDRTAASYARAATLSYYVYGHEYSVPVQLLT